MEGYKTVSLNVTLLRQLMETLPDEEMTYEVRQLLQQAYTRELETLLRTALSDACREPQVALTGWRQAGSQWIAEFWVSDLEKARTASTNFHGQNTSQWLYAGAIVVENGQVSTHH